MSMPLNVSRCAASTLQSLSVWPRPPELPHPAPATLPTTQMWRRAAGRSCRPWVQPPCPRPQSSRWTTFSRRSPSNPPPLPTTISATTTTTGWPHSRTGPTWQPSSRLGRWRPPPLHLPLLVLPPAATMSSTKASMVLCSYPPATPPVTPTSPTRLPTLPPPAAALATPPTQAAGMEERASRTKATSPPQWRCTSLR